MRRETKIAIAVASAVVVLPIVAIAGMVLLVGLFQFEPAPTVTREIAVANHGTLIIDGQKRGRSEHGFSQRAGYRPPGSANVEWFGDLSDGVDPQFYQAGQLIVVIDVQASEFLVTARRDSIRKPL